MSTDEKGTNEAFLKMLQECKKWKSELSLHIYIPNRRTISQSEYDYLHQFFKTPHFISASCQLADGALGIRIRLGERFWNREKRCEDFVDNGIVLEKLGLMTNLVESRLW